MTLDEACAELKSCFTVAPVGNYNQAATGEPYVTFVSGGIKEEGCPVVCWCSSEDHAIRLWRDAVHKYARQVHAHFPDPYSAAGCIFKRPIILYWRWPPQIERRKLARDFFYVVYSRLLISDKPQIQPQLLPPEPPTRRAKRRTAMPRKTAK